MTLDEIVAALHQDKKLATKVSELTYYCWRQREEKKELCLCSPAHIGYAVAVWTGYKIRGYSQGQFGYGFHNHFKESDLVRSDKQGNITWLPTGLSPTEDRGSFIGICDHFVAIKGYIAIDRNIF